MGVQPGERIRIKQDNVKDHAGATYASPDTYSIAIIKPDGTTQETVSAGLVESSGDFYIDFDMPDPAAEGKWKAKWTMVKGGANSNPDDNLWPVEP